MEETETTSPETTATPEATQPEVPAAPEAVKAETPPLTPGDLSKLEDKLTAELVAARKAAQRAESKTDVVDKRTEQRIRRIETMLEAIATRGMDEPDARAWKAERALERVNEAQSEQTQQQQYEASWRDFQSRGASLLQEEGIARDDPRLTAAFQRYAANAASTNDWDVALVRAISDVHKDEQRKAREEVKTVADKTREEERAKTRNEKRSSEGPTDKGSPSTAAPKDWANATNDEVLAELQRRRERRIKAGL